MSAVIAAAGADLVLSDRRPLPDDIGPHDRIRFVPADLSRVEDIEALAVQYGATLEDMVARPVSLDSPSRPLEIH